MVGLFRVVRLAEAMLQLGSRLPYAHLDAIHIATALSVEAGLSSPSMSARPRQHGTRGCKSSHPSSRGYDSWEPSTQSRYSCVTVPVT